MTTCSLGTTDNQSEITNLRIFLRVIKDFIVYYFRDFLIKNCWFEI